MLAEFLIAVIDDDATNGADDPAGREIVQGEVSVEYTAEDAYVRHNR